MDDDKNKSGVGIERLAPIIFGAVVATNALQMNGIALRDAKISLRISLFMVEELYRKNPKTEVDLKQLGRDLAHTMYELIKAEIAAEPQ